LFCQGFGKRNVHRLTGTLDKEIHGNHPDSSYMMNSQVWLFCSPHAITESSCKMKKTSSMTHFDRRKRPNTAFDSWVKSCEELFYLIISKRQRTHGNRYSGARPHSLADGSVIGHMISELIRWVQHLTNYVQPSTYSKVSLLLHAHATCIKLSD